MAKINVTFTTKEREFIERVLQEFLESNSEVDDVRLCVRIADKVNPPKMEEPDERDSETMEIKGNVAPIKRW